MKPSNLRLNPSQFFASPYRPNTNPSQLSPIPGSTGDPSTPLTPATVEKGRGGYFSLDDPPEASTSRVWDRMRSLRAGVGRRAICGVALVLGLILLSMSGTSILPTSTTHASHIYSKNTTSWPFFPHIPFNPPDGSSSDIPLSIQSPHSSATKHYVNGLKEGKREIDISSDALPVEASLRERLDIWKAAPGGRGEQEGEVELGGFVQWNLEQCSTITEQHNTHMIQKSANIWATMNRTTLHTHRTDLITYMEDVVLAERLTEDYGEGRGIVMVAGNADTLWRVKWSLEMLRSYGSDLPVQIYHFPSERPNPEDEIIVELNKLGAELVEAKGQEKDKGKNKSYHLKALAVIQCPWREVLYLDSDSIPTRDPAYMFDTPNYKRLGIYVTPDYWKTSANNPIWAIMGVKCRNEWEFETGQMFIDKRLHLDVFYLIGYMLERHEWWFYFSDGDKDIFRWALLALRKRWAVPGRWVGAAALPSGTASGDFCAHTMLQHDSYGEPLFVHYNLLKQIPSGIGRGFSWGRTKQLPLFNLWPASPSTARLGEPEVKPVDDGLEGLGEQDCDHLADADEFGNARRKGKEMIMRRAVRERGVKVRYHGGWISALCIDLDYIDPRPEDRKEADEVIKREEEDKRKVKDEEWEKEVERLKALDKEVPERPEEVREGPVRPDWGQSPLEVVMWRDDPNLSNFEGKIYDMGFKPSGPGF